MKKTIRFLPVWIFLFGLAACHDTGKSAKDTAPVTSDSTSTKPKDYFLDFDKEKWRIEADTVRRNETFGKILMQRHFSPAEVYAVTSRLGHAWDVRTLQVGKPYFMLYDKEKKDSTAKPSVFVYEQSPVDYRIIYLDTTLSDTVYRAFEKPVRHVMRRIGNPIRQSLFADLDRKGISPVLALKLSDIYAWTVDFFHLFPGDGFKAIYTDRYADDRYLGIGEVPASVFYHRGDTIYAFRYEFDTVNHRYDYFDEKGRSLRKQFLKSPLKFGRISSRYSMRRYVRIYGRIKPHLGTDFAAPVGTPIHATADGYIEKIGYTRGNGNYIKIRHNSTYATQYLHMSRFAKGMRKGVHVRQGDVIGYVGMTGYTTGPHVCYRFWKNGRQVDPFKQKLPQAKSLDSSRMDEFLKFIEPLKKQLDSIPYE
ncbi:MAG: M23 family metallopeptidase [Chlorobi bacterium]|nr:M23 family metallopeptidase [Chlorobiota bacterium]